MWADNADGTILLSVEMDRNDISNNHSFGESSSKPSAPPTIRMSWDGGIVGRTTADAYFEGVMEIGFVPGADGVGELSFTASRFYQGAFGSDHSIEWNIPTRKGLAAFGDSGVAGEFYGRNHEGIAGTIFDPSNDIQGAIFAALKK